MSHYCEACSWISTVNGPCENCPYGELDEIPYNVHPESVLGINTSKFIMYLCKTCTHTELEELYSNAHPDSALGIHLTPFIMYTCMDCETRNN